MTLHLSLPPDLENRLHFAALKNGKPTEQYALQLLEDNTPSKTNSSEKNLAAIAMFEAWAKEDEAMTDEESAENEVILRAIDEDRLSDRKLFTDILNDKPK